MKQGHLNHSYLLYDFDNPGYLRQTDHHQLHGHVHHQQHQLHGHNHQDHHQSAKMMKKWQVIGVTHQSRRRWSLDSGMIVVIFIIMVLLTLLATMLSSVNNNWCNLLFPNGTVRDCCYS